jgi:oligopeptide/dipeptide ABC transporter ATP-binding protein
MPAEPILTVSDLRTHFFAPHGVVRAVDGIDLTVRDGEAVAIVGESGSGKSMTALSILRLVPSPGRIVGGAIDFAGRDLRALGGREMRRLRASEIAEAFGRRGSRRPEDRARVLAALEDVRIADPARVAAGYAHELSGGMQQRVMIAAALARRPRLLIADEPTTALDATVQRDILDLLRDLRARNNLSLLLISHDLAVVADICDRVYVMYAGQVIESGPTRATLQAPNHPYTRALADAILDPWEARREIVPLDGDPPDMAAPPTGCRFHPRCPAVMDICGREQPATLAPAPDRSVACWLHAAREAVP